MSLLSEFLVFAFELDNSEAIGAEAASEALRDPSRRVWTHFKLQEGMSRELILEGLAIPQEAIELLTSAFSRPGVFEHEDGLLISLRGRNLNKGGEDDEDMVSLRFWITETEVLTVERRAVSSVREVKSMLDKRQRGLLPVDVFRMVVEVLNSKVMDMVLERTEEIDEIEELQMEGRREDCEDRLQQLRRDIVSIRRFLVPQRDVFSKLVAISSPLIGGSSISYFLRSEFERLQRAIDDLHMVQDRATLLHEEEILAHSERMNRNMYVLSVIAAIFLPLSFLSGALGMNVGGMPLSEHPWGFFLALGGMMLTGFVMWLVLRLMKLL